MAGRTRFLSSPEWSLAIPFSEAGEIIAIPLAEDFASKLTRWSIRLNSSGNSEFAVSIAPSVTGSFVDAIGAGTPPATTGAIGAKDTIDDWDEVDIPKGAVLLIECPTLTQPGTLTLHFDRV